MVSWLMFKYFIHLEFIFVYGISWWSSFIFLQVAVQLSQHHLLKRLFLLYFMLLLPLWNTKWPQRLGFISGSLFCSVDLCVCSYSTTRLLLLQWPCNTVWYQVLWFPPTLYLFLKVASAMRHRLWFHIYFWNVCSMSAKYVISTSIRMALNL